MSKGNKNNFQIFLCHANDDKPTARILYDRLTKDYIDVWFDEENLLPGNEWEMEIPKAIRKSDIVLVLLSNHSVTKEGYVQKEIKFALEAANEKPEGAIFIIPLRLENCKVPQSLSKWHWVNYFEEKWLEKLMGSFEERAEKVGKILRASRTESDLLFTCEVCKKPINSYGNEGQIYILRKELFEAQKVSYEISKRTGLIPYSELQGAIVHWHKAHYACTKEVDSFYEIEIHRIRTLQKLIDWTAHLMWKKWLNNTDWPFLMEEITGKHNVSL